VVLDVVDNTFNINLEQKANHTVIKIFAQDKEYSLMVSGKYHIFEVSECTAIFQLFCLGVVMHCMPSEI
jgi:hypothetical protein